MPLEQQEENTTLRRKTEDLSSKLRRTEILFARVNDELAKYRTAEGKTPFLNVDEEQCLRSKLQVKLRAEEDVKFFSVSHNANSNQTKVPICRICDWVKRATLTKHTGS